jgi:hypothetical protein
METAGQFLVSRKIDKAQFQRIIDHQAKGTLGVMMQNQNYAALEVGIHQLWNRDQHDGIEPGHIETLMDFFWSAKPSSTAC